MALSYRRVRGLLAATAATALCASVAASRAAAGHGQPLKAGGAVAADAGDGAGDAFPLPFYRPLAVSSPPLHGEDVYVLRGLLSRLSGVSVAACDGFAPGGVESCPYETATSKALSSLQRAAGLRATGTLDAETASAALDRLGADGYRWNGTAPARVGPYAYQITCAVTSNRSVEPTCALHAGNGSVVFRFVARLHGASVSPAPPWPNWNSTGSGLNQFAGDGATPTGLAELDLNSPEDDPAAFGPYPVNRAVVGLKGNARLLLTGTHDAPRNGILVHTGNWTCCGWPGPPAPMPNSLGCIHAWPESIRTIWKILTADFEVQVRPNTGGKVPYPYKSQGLLSVELVGDGDPWPAWALQPKGHGAAE